MMGDRTRNMVRLLNHNHPICAKLAISKATTAT